MSAKSCLQTLSSADSGDLVDHAEAVVTTTARQSRAVEIAGFIEDYGTRRICRRFAVEEAEHAVLPCSVLLGSQFKNPAEIIKTALLGRPIKIASRIERETSGRGW